MKTTRLSLDGTLPAILLGIETREIHHFGNECLFQKKILSKMNTESKLNLKTTSHAWQRRELQQIIDLFLLHSILSFLCELRETETWSRY